MEIRNSACVKSREFADIRFILFVPLCDCSNISSLVCDCIKTSSKYVIAFFCSISGLKFLHMKAEKAAGPMDIP